MFGDVGTALYQTTANIFCLYKTVHQIAYVTNLCDSAAGTPAVSILILGLSQNLILDQLSAYLTHDEINV